MKVRKVIRKLTMMKPSLEEIRKDNRDYVDALADEFGSEYAAEVERQYMEQVAKELEQLPEHEEVEVPMIQIGENEEKANKLASEEE